MGLSGISIWQLLIVLAVVILLFGTRKLRNVGSDLGAGIKGLRDGLRSDDGEETEESKAITSALDDGKRSLVDSAKSAVRRFRQ